jgi:hypothetical protein
MFGGNDPGLIGKQAHQNSTTRAAIVPVPSAGRVAEAWGSPADADRDNQCVGVIVIGDDDVDRVMAAETTAAECDGIGQRFVDGQNQVAELSFIEPEMPPQPVGELRPSSRGTAAISADSAHQT